MELTQLRYFYAVYHVKNICAAEQLNVTQQAVSKQIQKLELELGITLFERGARGVKATAYADELAEKAKRILPELDAFVYDIQAKNSEPTGVLRLGIQCWQMSSAHVLRYDVLKDFQRQYPRISLIWENCTPPRCISGLLSHDLDLAVMSMPKDPSNLELTLLRRSKWYMLMSNNHPLAKKKELKTSDLAGQRIILAEDEINARNRILRRIGNAEKPVFVGINGFIFDIIGQEIEGENALMLSTGTILDMFNPERFTMVPMDADYSDTRLYLARLEGIAHPPAEKALFQFLLEKWGKFSQQ